MNGPRHAAGSAAAAAATAAAAAALLGACASEPVADTQGFDASAGRTVVTLLGGEFALLDGERMPLDAAILRLRLRARAMTPEQRARFVVRVDVAADVPEAAQPHVTAAYGRMMQELTVMEIDQLELRGRT
jgi:hypothetical protein